MYKTLEGGQFISNNPQCTSLDFITMFYVALGKRGGMGVLQTPSLCVQISMQGGLQKQ